MFLYAGNFTGGALGGTPAEGISVFGVDAMTGAIERIQVVSGLHNPTFLARHPRLPILYALQRRINPDGSPTTPDQQRADGVTAFAIDPQRGTLTRMGHKPCGGSHSAHISIHPGGRFAFIANPRSSNVTVMRLQEDGEPGDICAEVKHEGRGPHARQKTAFPHSVFADPPWRRLLICDFGIDRVMIYRFDERSGALIPAEQPYAQISSGAGPRHLAFHPSGRFFYTVNELDATVSAFTYDVETGAASILQTASIQPADHRGKKSGSEILVGPGGRLLYASDRASSTIAIFAIDPASGALDLVEHCPTLGASPRNFSFDPSGKLLLVANQHGGNIVSFRVEEMSGALRPTGHSASAPSPACIVFGT